MPPSFATPPPHRFVNPSSQRQPAQPRSSSHYGDGQRSPANATSRPDAQRFAQVPKFRFGARKRKDVAEEWNRPAPSPLRREIQTHGGRSEEIEEALPEEPGDAEGDEDEDMLDSGHMGTLRLEVEPARAYQVGETPVERTVHKRRRLSPSASAPPPSSTADERTPWLDAPERQAGTTSYGTTRGFQTTNLQPPNRLPCKHPQPLHKTQTPPRTIPRFVIPAPTAPPPWPRLPPSFSIPTASATAQPPAPLTSTRPSFILPAPDPGPSETHSPLPESFSPHRKGQKFIPGGMAAEVREWVVEAGQQAVAARRAVYMHGQGDFVITVVVSDVSRGGDGDGSVMRFVRGVRRKGIESMAGEWDGAGEKRYLLVGSSKGGARVSDGVKRGDVLGIRAPVWEVDLEGERWVVGVDWGLVGVER